MNVSVRRVSSSKVSSSFNVFSAAALVAAQARRKVAAFAICFAVLVGLFAAPVAAHAISPIVVTTLADDSTSPNAGNCPGSSCSLADAITAANLASGGTITFGVNGTITLTGTLPALTSNIDIIGPGANLLTISGGGMYQMFSTTVGNVTVSISGLTLSHASTTLPGGVLYSVLSNTLTLDGITFQSNNSGNGGAIFFDTGSLTISNSTFVSNTTSTAGGAVRVLTVGSPTINITNSTFYNNQAAEGGAIEINAQGGTIAIVNNTFVNNSASLYGGAILSAVPVPTQYIIDSNIFSGNKATSSGGLGGAIYDGFNVAVAQANHFYNNTDPNGEDDCYQCLSSQVTAGSGSNPNLLPLGYYGGATQTFLPQPLSPVICQSTNYGSISSDQRGYPLGGCTGVIDVGADQTNYQFVTSNADSGTGSLRAALTGPNSTGVDIGFNSAAYGTIALGSTLPTISTPVTIVGNPANNASVVIDGGGSNRIFSSNSDLSLSYVTLQHGNAGVYSGGAINNGTGFLSVYNDVFTGNMATACGAVSTYGNFVVSSSTFTSNSATNNPAALCANNVGQFNISDSTFTANTSAYGGALGLNSSTGTVDYNTFYNNQVSGYGSAVYQGGGSVLFDNNTVVGNAAQGSGGAYVTSGSGSTAAITNNIFAMNGAQGNGAGIADYANGATVNNNIFYKNLDNQSMAEDDCGNCLSNTNSITASISPVTAFGSYGGPTQTMLPQPNSGSTCASNSALIPAGVTTDQRGNANFITYGSGPTYCYDLGAVQAKYTSVYFTNIPISGDYTAYANQTPNPAPIVAVTESGNNVGGVLVTLTDASSTVTGTSATTVAGTGAVFSSLQDSDVAGEDTTLSATMKLAPGYGLVTSRTPGFDVAQTDVNVTITTNPVGLNVGAGAAGGPTPVQSGAPLMQTWTIPSQYTMTTTSPQYSSDNSTRYTFEHWVGGGFSPNQTRTVTASAATTTYTADFQTAYLLSVVASGSGTVTPTTSTTSYYNAGNHVNITATPAAGYYFAGWTDTSNRVHDASSATTYVTMNGADTVTANFLPVPAYVVTTTNDSNDGSCSVTLCSLRDAITAANGNAGGAGAITFKSGLTGTITLTSALPALSGLETITGPGSSSIAVSGNNLYRVFSTNTGAMVGISGLAVENGASNYGAGIDTHNATSVTISGVAFAGNTATTHGGALSVDPNGGGSVTVTDSSFANNSSPEGGAIYVVGGTLTVDYSTFNKNSSTATNTNDNAGAIDVAGGSATVSNSTFDSNTAARGAGAIYYGGFATMDLNNSIVSGNTGTTAGGVYDGTHRVHAHYTLFNGNTGTDCAGCNTNSNEVTGAATLAALGNYGGTIATELPEPGSAAICAGSSTLIPIGFTSDERGTANTQSYNSTTCVDLGAVQTHYAVSFTTQPPTTVEITENMSPAPVVTLTENGVAYATTAATVSMTDAQSDLTTTPQTSSTSTVTATAGQASFGSLAFTNVTTSNDTLTGTVTLNGTTSTTVATTSNGFAVTLITTTTTLSSNLNPAMAQNPITLTATVNSDIGHPGTGVVNFYTGGTTLLGTGNVGTGGVATYVINPSTNPTQLVAGTYSLTAQYQKTGNFASSTSSPPLSQVIDDFSFAITIQSITVIPGQGAVVTFTVTPINGTTFPAAITLSISGLPTGATDTFTPATIAAGSGTQSVTLAINVPAANQYYTKGVKPVSPAAPMGERLAPLALGLLLLPFSRRMRKSAKKISRVMMIAVFIVAGIAATVGISGCGSGHGYFSQPVQSYTITLTGTSGSLSHSTTFTLTVE